MVTKTNTGDYKCYGCGNIYSNHRKAKKHEEVCLEEELNNFIDNIEKTVNLGCDTDKKAKNGSQLKLGERPLKPCENCGNKITSRHSIEKGENLFKCRECGNIVKREN